MVLKHASGVVYANKDYQMWSCLDGGFWPCFDSNGV